MGIKPAVVIYTHTDMVDVWKVFFGQHKKYMSEYKTYVCVNKHHNDIPSEYIQVYYDESKSYTERLVESLAQINEEIIMFTHEDMILFDTPNHEYIEKYTQYISENLAESIKLIFAGSNQIKSVIDDSLVYNDYSKLSIQPTIMKKDVMYKTALGVGSMNIWNFEQAIVSAGRDYSVLFGTEKKRGIYHYDSIVYPYIATAINKGKWNYSEYETEMESLFREYDIVPFERGIV